MDPGGVVGVYPFTKEVRFSPQLVPGYHNT